METGRFVDVIHKKRAGRELTEEEIREMIQGYVEHAIPDYQMSAMLMAICFRGMSDRELTAMTMAMRDSGDVVDLSEIPGIKVDKHSTGGVGDKTTLIIVPVAAACSVPVAKMSGRGLGFTGGTLDKLESIPGFRVFLTREEFFGRVNECGLCVAGQTGNLAPADKLLYALRDVTSTVDSIPLIASSIMSKKLAAGSDKILLDVTTGSGALIKDPEGSRELAERMVAIGKGAGKETVAMITGMEEPLGYAIGNNLEVKEAITALQGGGPDDLREVVLGLAGMMIALGKEISYEKGRKLAAEELDSGRAFAKFKAFVKGQGGDVRYIEEPERFETAAGMRTVTAGSSGYITKMDTEGIGISAGILGAGRATKDSVIDHSAGIIMKKKLGDAVRQGETVAELYAGADPLLRKAAAYMADCITIGPEKPDIPKLVVDIIR